jgi:outer membrane biosynthesis protein TonB
VTTPDETGGIVKTLKTVTDVATLPARATAHVAAAALGSTVGAATIGLRAGGQLVGWALGRAVGARTDPAASPWPTDAPARVTPTTAPVTPTTALASVPPTQTAPVAEEPPAAPASTAPAPKEPARKAPASKAPASKAPARKPARKKAPSKKAAVMAPALGLSEAEVEDELRTPSGIPAAGDGFNPDTDRTDLHQPGTEPLMDPGTVKAAAAELRIMQRAADPDKR